MTISSSRRAVVFGLPAADAGIKEERLGYLLDDLHHRVERIHSPLEDHG